MEIYVATKSEIEQIINDTIERKFDEIFETLKNQQRQNEWLSKEDLKGITGWSDSSIQHLRDTRQIPFSQHDRKILYPRQGIEEFLEKHMVERRKR